MACTRWGRHAHHRKLQGRHSFHSSLRNRASRFGIWDKHWFAFSIRLYIKYCTYEHCAQTWTHHLETPGKQKYSQYFTLATMVADTIECTVPLFHKWRKRGPRNYLNHKTAMKETCSQHFFLYTRNHQPNITCAHSYVLKLEFVQLILDVVLAIRPSAFYILSKPFSLWLSPRLHLTFPH